MICVGLCFLINVKKERRNQSNQRHPKSLLESGGDKNEGSHRFSFSLPRKSHTKKEVTTMSATQIKSMPELDFEYHVNAAKFCNKAAIEHSQAAQCCATGNVGRAKGHAKIAYDYVTKVQDLGRQAINRQADC